MNAATLVMPGEQATADLSEGKLADQENRARNVALLGQLLIKLGAAQKCRDITKRDQSLADDFGTVLIAANRAYLDLMSLAAPGVLNPCVRMTVRILASVVPRGGENEVFDVVYGGWLCADVFAVSCAA
jgi:hypothetical protein